MGAPIITNGPNDDLFYSPNSDSRSSRVTSASANAGSVKQNSLTDLLTNKSTINNNARGNLDIIKQGTVGEGQYGLFKLYQYAMNQGIYGNSRNGSSAMYSFQKDGAIYGQNNIVDLFALDKYNSDIYNTLPSEDVNYLTNTIDSSRSSSNPSAALFNVSGVHLDTLRTDDQWLRTQAKYLKESSDSLMKYVTKDNGDGTYNLNIPAGSDFGKLSQANQGGFKYDWKDQVDRGWHTSSNDVTNQNLENVQLFKDYNQAYKYAQQSGFLYNAKKQALTQVAYGGIYSSENNIYEWDPLRQIQDVSKSNMIQELNYGADVDLYGRIAKNEKYKRDAESVSTMRSGVGIQGSSAANGLRVSSATLLGNDDE